MAHARLDRRKVIEHVYAVFDFAAENEDELSFCASERVDVLDKDDQYGDGWWVGRNLSGKIGLFPRAYTAAPSQTNMGMRGSPAASHAPSGWVVLDSQSSFSPTFTNHASAASSDLGRLANEEPRAPSDEFDLSSAVSWLNSHKNISLSAEEAQRWADFLDNAGMRYIQAMPLDDGGNQRVTLGTNNLEPYRRALRCMRKLCRTYNVLPSTFTVSGNLAWDPRPSSQSAISDVYKGTLDGKLIALKALRVHIDNVEAVKKAFHEEAVVWRLLSHPNTTPFLGICHSFHVSMVSEWMANGTVLGYLQGHTNANPYSLCVNIMHGLSFVHTLDLVHGDLKASNVLVDDLGNARLTDFGLTTVYQNSGTLSVMTSARGTLRWMAPEMLSGDASQPTVETDMYALGMTIWQLFSRCIPFDNQKNEFGVVRCVLADERPSRPPDTTRFALEDAAWAAIRLSWATNPQDRPDLSSTLEVFEKIRDDVP